VPAFGDPAALGVLPVLARQVPLILTLGQGGHAMLSRLGRVGPALSALLQQHRDFEGLLDALGAEWRFDSLVRGDMKWDNVLIYPVGGGLDFRIVDWEMADFGDTAWDVGYPPPHRSGNAFAAAVFAAIPF
jgi:hypothetical protein